VLVERIGKEGWAVATDGVFTVALDTRLDDELRLEARLFDLIRAVQVLRKETGLEITDRIRLWIPDAELLQFSERIAEETLAVSVALGPELRLEKAPPAAPGQV
jgi:isoleucyl-tRNA synthetase